MEWDSLHSLTLAMNFHNYLVSCGVSEDVVSDFIDTLSKADSIKGSVDTSDGARLPNDDTVSTAWSILFVIGAVLNNVLTWNLEVIVGSLATTRSSSLIKEFNLFYQEIFSNYIKPLNQIIAFHEHRL